ncbi:hypothetical protein Tco_0960129, partial [Tanacetum coccineum]
AGRPAAESLGGRTGVRVGRGGRGRRPREGNDEYVDDLNGQVNDQGLRANRGVEGVNGNVEKANRGAPDFLTIIVQQLHNLLPAKLAQVGNQGNVGNQNGNVVNENVQENVGNVLVNGNRVGIEHSELGFRYEIEIASMQLVEIDKVIKGCKLEIEGHVFDIDLTPLGHGSFDVIIDEVHEDDVHRSAFITRYGHFKLHNDILIYSKTREEHVEQLRLVLELLKKEKLFIKNFSKLSKSLTILTQKCKTFDWGEEQELAFQTLKDKLLERERVKPKRVRAMNMTLQSSIKDRILAAQKEAMDESAGLQKDLDEMIEQRSNGTLYYLDRIWVPLKGDVRTLIMDEAHKSRYFVHPGADKMCYDLRDRLRLSIKDHLACSSNLRFLYGNGKE